MTHEEAQLEAERLQREHPERATHRWLAQQVAGYEWRVVRVAAPFGSQAPSGAHTESRPKPPTPPDPRPDVNPNIIG